MTDDYDDGSDEKLDSLSERIDQNVKGIKESEAKLEYIDTYQDYQKKSNKFSTAYMAETFGPALMSSTLILLDFTATKIIQAASLFAAKKDKDALILAKDIAEKIEQSRTQIAKLKSEKGDKKTIAEINQQVKKELMPALDKVLDKIPAIVRIAYKYKNTVGSWVDRIGITGFLEIVLLVTGIINTTLFIVQRNAQKKLDLAHQTYFDKQRTDQPRTMQDA